MISQLRLRRISPPMLARKLKSNSKVAVLDLANFEGEETDKGSEGIPGALVVDPTVLGRSPSLTLPEDLKVILYSSTGSDAVCARAAVGLKRIGVDEVWVLEGGLKAWREYGLPTSMTAEAPEAVAKRLGVTLPRHTRPNESSV
jgi:3-mercaptopyruvate sulfurtransferase SseA